ncbi:MAG TPA: hypothetical protein VGK54_04330, partial [Chloroflexota bacterium]
DPLHRSEGPGPYVQSRRDEKRVVGQAGAIGALQDVAGEDIEFADPGQGAERARLGPVKDGRIGIRV